MTQIATVERIIDNDHAEISVPRKSACGHDCEECAGCGVSGAAVHAKAVNTIGAQPGQKVVVIDDLIATGGTIEAAIQMIEELGGEVVKVVFLMELAGLNGREKLAGYDVESVICYEGK